MPDIESVLQAILRWFHVIAGITWIGHLYFFNFVNLPFQGGLAKELKPTVNPPLILRALYFFRHAAMWTFLFGIALFALVYWPMGGNLFTPEGRMSERGMWVLFGGLLGIALGFGLSEALERTLQWPTSIPTNAIGMAFGFVAATGVFFGFYPARKAAQLDPIEALRFE